MPNQDDVLFRNRADPDNWFNAPANSSGLRAVGVLQLGQQALGDYFITQEWVDFWYDWTDTVYSYGDQTSWYRDGNAICLKPGTYQISCSFLDDYVGNYNVCLSNLPAWRRVGYVSHRVNHSQVSWSGVVEVPPGDDMYFSFQRADDNGNGQYEDCRTTDWELSIIKYAIIGGQNPDECLARTDPTDDWTNQDSTQVIGGLVAYTATRPNDDSIAQVRDDIENELTWCVWTSTEHPNQIIYDTSGIYFDPKSGYSGVDFKEDGLYEVKLQFTPDRPRRMSWSRSSTADPGNCRFGTMVDGGRQTSISFVSNVKTNTNLRSAGFITDITNFLREMDIYSTTVTVLRLGPPL